MEQLWTGDIVDGSGSPSLHIPTEVCENIIDKLYSQFTQDTFEHITALRSCALVCRDWRVRSQRMLFYLVQLFDSTSLHRLAVVLDAGQHLCDYVHYVELTGYHLHTTASIAALFPIVFAGKLPNLSRVEIVHLQEADEAWFPKTRIPDPPKSKSLTYIPLHPRFPAFLAAFTTVSSLQLASTTFRSFSEFVRTLHGLPNLEKLSCCAVRWLNPGCAHPAADLTDSKKPPAPAVSSPGEPTLRPFAPKLRELQITDMVMYGAERLISMHGPRLTYLDLTIPLSEGQTKDTTNVAGQTIDLSACTGLRTLVLGLTPQFLTDTHAASFVRALLTSWKPQHSVGPTLVLGPRREDKFTRRGFADTLRSVGTITEAWLQEVEEPPATGDPKSHHPVQYWLYVWTFDWETERKWWADHVDSCFPTWVRLGRLSWDFDAPQNKFQEWANEEPLQPADTFSVAPRVEDPAPRT